MTLDQTHKFALPGKLEKILASLSIYYGQNEKPTLQRLLVNSRYHVQEEWTYDNWDGGTYGHAIYFQVPSAIYYEIFDNLGTIATEIKEGVNRIANVQNEYIHEVFLELQEDPSLENWRDKSGVLIHSSPASVVTSEEQLGILWKSKHLRLFICHKAGFKKLATDLKEAMECYGVSCFVAHEDIEPTKEWQDEIEKALFSMDALLALMTEDFHNSDWTDQEIGVAVGRRTFIIPVRLGMDPYGFIGKYQAVPPSANSQPTELALKAVIALLQHPHTSTKLIDAYIAKMRVSENYAESERLAGLLPSITKLDEAQVKAMLEAFNSNSQVYDCFAINGEKGWSYGGGLPAALYRITGRSYVIRGLPKQIMKVKDNSFGGERGGAAPF